MRRKMEPHGKLWKLLLLLLLVLLGQMTRRFFAVLELGRASSRDEECGEADAARTPRALRSERGRGRRGTTTTTSSSSTGQSCGGSEKARGEIRVTTGKQEASGDNLKYE
ncbi:hypothetical protein GALMADRAFT_213417 [Galerina marginata CBS 339.88]|uniref:Uncharacterized protein n=1 Tax=Galerina marginata (strain CBS 339.88) TaxID=685588 RepID=A0A067SNJ1_GALM3|nr:hypothetical protein GALMADRAFT_213417 [Galerina marginata CBS 339.88]